MTTNPRTDTHVSANLSVTATFAINQYTLTYTAGQYGSISGITPQDRQLRCGRHVGHGLLPTTVIILSDGTTTPTTERPQD